VLLARIQSSQATWNLVTDEIAETQPHFELLFDASSDVSSAPNASTQTTLGVSVRSRLRI
jgi:hypothetical protein